VTLRLHVREVGRGTDGLAVDGGHLRGAYHEVLEMLAAELGSARACYLVELDLYLAVAQNIVVNYSFIAWLHEISSRHLFVGVFRIQREDIIGKLSLIHLRLNLLPSNINIKRSCLFGPNEYFSFGLITYSQLKLKLLILKRFIIKRIANQRL
jgi:hypothetical protein